MKILVKQVAKLVAVLALCHVALLGVSLWLYPIQARVDTIDHENSLFRDQFQSAVNLSLESGFQDDEQVIIVGPSNALLGFRPDEVERRMPGVRVHNLATASMRSDEIRKLVQMAWSIMPEEHRPRTTFVVSVIFTSFPSAGSIYMRREAGVAHEIRRSGSFRELDDEIDPRWTGLALRTVTLLRRPLALVDAWRDDLARIVSGTRNFLLVALRNGSLDTDLLGKSRPPLAMLFPRADSEENRQMNLSMLRYFTTAKGTALAAAQFEELSALVRWAGDNDVRLRLVGMPVPSWVRDGLPYYDDYRNQLDPILRQMRSLPSVRFIDLHDADLPMWDATHPEPARTGDWAKALASALEAP